MPMIARQTRRRRFLVAAISLAGLGATPLPVAILRSSAAWANSDAGEDSAQLMAMTKLARHLFPYDRLADSVFAEVLGEVLAITVADPSTEKLLQSLEDKLDEQSARPWASLDNDEQLRMIVRLQNSALFESVLGLVRFRLHYHPEVWELLGYPGSSVEYGGYVDRGFDDIDWLPAVS
jgi:hypothetical protein